MRRRLPRLRAGTAVRGAIAAIVAFIVIAGSAATLSGGYYTAADWQSLVVNGFALGSVYALVALGYTLVYGILYMINFAHGEVFMAGTFTALFVSIWLHEVGLAGASPWLALVLTLLAAMGTSMSVAILLERVAYRRLRSAPRLVPLITAIGASLVLQYTLRGMYGAGIRSFPDEGLFHGLWTIGPIVVQADRAAVIAVAIVLMVALLLFVHRSDTGRAMRAVSEDKAVAAMMGVNVDRVIVTTFALGGLLAGAAGILYTLIFNQVHYFMGFLPGIKAFTAAVLGGIGSITGAMAGGVVLGVLESVGPFLLLRGLEVPSPNQLKDVVAFAVLVVVLVLRPTGLFGRREHI